MGRHLVLVVAVLVSGAFLLSSAAVGTDGEGGGGGAGVAQQALPAGSLAIKFLTEKKVAALSAGPLFWRVENFPTLAQVQAARPLQSWSSRS